MNNRSITTEPPSIAEIKIVISSLKLNKSAGIFPKYEKYRCARKDNRTNQRTLSGCRLQRALQRDESNKFQVDSIRKKTNTDAPGGIQWRLHQKLCDLDYSDGICFLAHRLLELKDK